MIHLDRTKAGPAAPRSGLTRVAARLAAALGDDALAVRWPEEPAAAQREDWLLTTELFSEAERPGVSRFLAERPCRCAALFHDAIPLRHPHITWPQSVARHPGYMKLLAQFDRVWAVSRASRDDLLGFWRWQGLESVPPVEVLALGADFGAGPRITTRVIAPSPPRLLAVGIVEPRKNQGLLLDACEPLWREGLRFELHLVGRVNPHFGPPLLARIKDAARRRPGAVQYYAAVDDAMLTELYASARATLFPTIAEGCGLPLLESLWHGVPCVCSDLPVLRENADGGGCLPVQVTDVAAWTAALRRVLLDEPLVRRLTNEATTRFLPTWAEAAATLRGALMGGARS
ncbi:glycosyltransferase [Opitutus sp. ER46]|uniref:glycosyltransferase n=1 Tax=Opitutus sp. ER46 TaxID=2161864 RepID=UPI000D321B1D|nr:glycosyltransferase [Opitutus sp. ER46]PTX97739.1 hypothetical protein DB354_05510 [Opitutus sp. ER46]